MREGIREEIIQLSARKLSRWYAGRRTLDFSTRRVRNAMSRALDEAGEEVSGASEFLDDLSGDEMADLQDRIAKLSSRRL